MLLALIPGYRFGAFLNVLASGLTFLAGASLLFDPRYRSDILIVDDFNVYLVTLTTFVAFTTSIFSASYIGHELETGRLTPTFLRLLSRALSGDDRRDERGAGRQQRRPALGRRRGRDAHHRDDGRHLPHAGGGRGRLEILHPRLGRHRARVLRHHPGLSRGPGGAGRGAAGDGLGHHAVQPRRTSIPSSCRSPSSSCWSATAPRSASRRSTPGCPTPMPKARRRSRRCCRACCSTSRSMRCCASR